MEFTRRKSSGNSAVYAIAASLLLAFTPHPSDAGVPASKQMRVTSNGYYVRVPANRVWRLNFVGRIESLAGLYIVLHDAGGRVLFEHEVPFGTYTDESPLVVTVPAQAALTDCRFVILGDSDGVLGLSLPISDLEHEVYGHLTYTMNQVEGDLYFKPTAGRAKVRLRASTSATLIVYQGGTVIGDVTKDGSPPKDPADDQRLRDFGFEPEADAMYRLHVKTRYFHSPGGTYFSIAPERWFEPDPALNKVKWWHAYLK